MGSSVVLHLNDALMEPKNEFLNCFAQFLPQAGEFLFSFSTDIGWLEYH